MLGVLFSTAMKAVVAAKLKILGILLLTSFFSGISSSSS